MDLCPLLADQHPARGGEIGNILTPSILLVRCNRKSKGFMASDDSRMIAGGGPSPVYISLLLSAAALGSQQPLNGKHAVTTAEHTSEGPDQPGLGGLRDAIPRCSRVPVLSGVSEGGEVWRVREQSRAPNLSAFISPSVTAGTRPCRSKQRGRRGRTREGMGHSDGEAGWPAGCRIKGNAGTLGRNMGELFCLVFGWMFGWAFAYACALLLDAVALAWCWTVSMALCGGENRPISVTRFHVSSHGRAPEALEDPVNDSSCSEEVELGPEEWSDPAPDQEQEPEQEQAQDTMEEYFDTHSWQSDTLSDLIPDGDDCPAAPPTTGGPCRGWTSPAECTSRPTEGSSESGPSETQQGASDGPPKEDPCMDLCSVSLGSCTGRGRCVSGSTEQFEPFWPYEDPYVAGLQTTPKEAGLPLTASDSDLGEKEASSPVPSSETDYVNLTAGEVQQQVCSCPDECLTSQQALKTYSSELADSSELKSEIFEGGRGGLAHTSSGEGGDDVCLPQSQGVEDFVNPPATHTESFESSGQGAQKALTNDVEPVLCLFSPSDVSLDLTSDLHCNFKQPAHTTADALPVMGEALTESPGNSEHLSESQNGVSDPRPSQEVAVGTCASDPEDVLVRRWEVILDIPEQQYRDDLSRLRYFSEFPALSEWHSDTNNNTKSILEGCTNDPFDAESEVPVEQACPVTDEPLFPYSSEVVYCTEDYDEEESTGPLWEQEEDRDPSSSSGSDLENGAWDRDDTFSTPDYGPRHSSQDLAPAEGICSQLNLPDEGKLDSHQQGSWDVYDGPRTQDYGSFCALAEGICSQLDPPDKEEQESQQQERLKEAQEVCHDLSTASPHLTHSDAHDGEFTMPNDPEISQNVPSQELDYPDNYVDEGLSPGALNSEARDVLSQTALGVTENEHTDGEKTEEQMMSLQGCPELSPHDFETNEFSSLNFSYDLPSVNSLEPILESDYSQDNSFIVEDEGSAEPHEEVQQGNSSDTYTPPHTLSLPLPPYHPTTPESARDESPSTDSEPQESTSSPELCGSKATSPMPNGDVVHEGHHTPTNVSCDPDTTSTNSEETDDSAYSLLGSNSSLHKAVKNKGARAGSTGKTSKFSVFSRIPSFRKSKNSAREGKGYKAEPSHGASTPERDEGSWEGSPKRRPHPSLHRAHLSLSTDHLREAGQQGGNLDDEVFDKGMLIAGETEEYGFCPSEPRTRHVRQLYSQTCDRDPSGDNSKAPGLGSPNPAERLGHKRSKSSDSLNLWMRLSLAHKSLSNLFESRPPEMEAEEDSQRKTKPSWRGPKQAKEAELLKRAMSVPDSSGSSVGRSARQVHSDYALRSAQDRLKGPPVPPRASRYSDPLSKKGILKEPLEDSSNESKSEEMRGWASPPNSLSLICQDSTPHTPWEESEFPPLEECRPASPLSPTTVAALALQLAPSWTRSLGSFEGMDGPLRPMSPKPQSPRPGVYRRSFRYPSRATTVSLLSLGQGVSVEGLSDPPERPKTLKPKVAQLASVVSLTTECQRDEIGVDSPLPIGLATSMSVNEFESAAEVTARTQFTNQNPDLRPKLTQDSGRLAGPTLEKRLPELAPVLRAKRRGQRTRAPRPVSDLGCWATPPRGEGEAEPGSSKVGQGTEPAPGPAPRPGAGPGLEKAQESHCCSDDLCVEVEKNRQRRMTVATLGCTGLLTIRTPGEATKVRCLDANTIKWWRAVSYTLLSALLGPLSHAPAPARARLSLTSTEPFPSLALRDQCFSQSTPIGLDCLGWPRCVSSHGEYCFCSELICADGSATRWLPYLTQVYSAEKHRAVAGALAGCLSPLFQRMATPVPLCHNVPVTMVNSASLWYFGACGQTELPSSNPAEGQLVRNPGNSPQLQFSHVLGTVPPRAWHFCDAAVFAECSGAGGPEDGVCRRELFQSQAESSSLIGLQATAMVPPQRTPSDCLRTRERVREREREREEGREGERVSNRERESDERGRGREAASASPRRAGEQGRGCSPSGRVSSEDARRTGQQPAAGAPGGGGSAQAAGEGGSFSSSGGSVSGSGSSGLSPGSDSDGSPGAGRAGSMGGVRGFGLMSRYWSLESLHSTTGKRRPPPGASCFCLVCWRGGGGAPSCDQVYDSSDGGGVTESHVSL
ncbi:hypothetical protein JZ751_013775 [Albula glossodonta]|uniref:Uncharacterized protein n=1 Tax=Albula glossodonta TaxID=121402 RepID=A0A8T2NTC1_9TELE|nr:hypothetical protein JZ751_013775 [Albula glossodonta]